MEPAKFALLLGTNLLAFLFVVTFYVVWTRVVGLEPTVAQWCADLSQAARIVVAIVAGAALGAASLVAPTVEVGVASVVLFAASTFAALMLFELFQQRHYVAS